MTKMPTNVPTSSPTNAPTITKMPSNTPTNSPTTSGIANYVHMAKGCVNGRNIKLYKNKSVKECAIICDNTPTCKGFEYGVAYGGRGRYVPGDCQPQYSSDTRNCNGGYHNLDFYKQVVTTNTPTADPTNAPTLTKMPTNTPTTSPTNAPTITKMPSNAPTSGN